MKADIPYLSDEELMRLIAETEEEDTVMAPPDLVPGVMQSIRASGKSAEERKREFQRYCIRVMASMAAAIALVFTMPSLLDTASRVREETQAQDFTRQDASREKESTLFTEVLGGHTFFSGEGLFRSFFEKGGS